MVWWWGAASAGTVCSAGCDFASMREAVASVPPGGVDVFTVSPGNYEEPASVTVDGDRDVTFVGGGAVTASNGGNGATFVVSGGTSRLTVTGMSITAFNARAVEVHGGTATLVDDVLYTIGLQGLGGAVLVDGGALDAQDSLFLDNVATSGGGHLAVVDAEATLTDCTFSGGFARRGGAVLVSGSASPARVTITGGRFDDNLAAEIGGAVAVTGRGELVVWGAAFEENAAEYGGAIADDGAVDVPITVQGARFDANRADLGGGALAAQGALWTVTDSRFERNVAAEGGAAWVSAGAVSFVRDVLCANVADLGGAVWSRTLAEQVWENARLVENVATVGGAVDHGGGTLTLRYTSVLGNRAELGGAVRSEDEVVVRSSIVAWTEGSAALIGAPVRSDWNVYWGNVGGDLVGEAVIDGAPERDRTADPRLDLYQLGDGCAAADDFHSWYGPLHDGGDDADRDPDGSRADIGAFGGPSAGGPAWSGDLDGDGYPPLYDCAEGDPAIHPEAPDAPYDGIDQDCDRGDDFDRDGDGYREDLDCDDNDPRVNPGAEDLPGEDRDCDEGIDVDGDGYSPPLDCDDTDERVHPGAVEDWDPAVDLDCTPPGDVTAGLEPRTCGTSGAPGGDAALVALAAACVAARRRRRAIASGSPGRPASVAPEAASRVSPS